MYCNWYYVFKFMVRRRVQHKYLSVEPLESPPDKVISLNLSESLYGHIGFHVAKSTIIPKLYLGHV
jgi:hypothetical protein